MAIGSKDVQLNQRVEPQLDSDSTFNISEHKPSLEQPRQEEEVKQETRSERRKRKREEKQAQIAIRKKKWRWFNWLISLALIGTGLGFLFFYPKPEPLAPVVSQQSSEQPESPAVVFKPESLAAELVSRYFNGTPEDKNEQQIALANTLIMLSESPNTQASKALTELRKSNLNVAKKHLVALAGNQENLRQASKTWVNVGNIQNLSSANQALQAYKKASELDPDNIDAYARQGHVYRQLKQFDLAEKAYKRVQSFANQSTANQALTLTNFGVLNLSKGKLVEAEDAFNEALSIYKRIGNEEGIANASYHLANLYKDSERLKQAESYYKTALKTFTTQDSFKQMADTQIALGHLFLAMNAKVKAQNRFEMALELCRNNNFEENLPDIYKNLGEIAAANGEEKKAQAYFAKASGDESETQDNSVADALGKQAIDNRKQGRFLIAEEQHKQAIKIYQQNQNIVGTISQQINLGFLYKAWGKKDLACLVWRDTYVISQRANSNRASRVKKLLDDGCN